MFRVSLGCGKETGEVRLMARRRRTRATQSPHIAANKAQTHHGGSTHGVLWPLLGLGDKKLFFPIKMRLISCNSRATLRSPEAAASFVGGAGWRRARFRGSHVVA